MGFATYLTGRASETRTGAPQWLAATGLATWTIRRTHDTPSCERPCVGAPLCASVVLEGSVMLTLVVALAWLALGWVVAALWGEWVQERDANTKRKEG